MSLRETASNADFKAKLAGLLAGGPPGKKNPMGLSASSGGGGRAMTMLGAPMGMGRSETYVDPTALAESKPGRAKRRRRETNKKETEVKRATMIMKLGSDDDGNSPKAANRFDAAKL